MAETITTKTNNKKVDSKAVVADDKKIKSLKIELLKQPQKAKNIRKEIARILTSTKLGDEK
jgi:hypothetical protein